MQKVGNILEGLKYSFKALVWYFLKDANLVELNKEFQLCSKKTCSNISGN